ncbi:BppU family phage baseplate upper protein [Enterococcus faecium]|uniref:BppU family phage baseplate upper protein n=1 Tax=Enterococcus faecium TaxID=1352 RepID=UPI002543E395|nr:BppU family phage baseplate upper protein [Enterococcus faecium]MDK4464817.1 BppU family phage baseplate upper protein [Enterococcus faecium]
MVYKTNESIIVIQAEATSPNRTNVVFWSHDRGTAKLRMKLVRKDGIPQSLPEGTTVPIRLMFKSATAEGGYGKHDYLATIEDPVNGIVSIVLEDNILGYVGTVEGSVYIDFPNDRSLDTAGRFTFYIKRSPIDDSTPELEDYYFNGFSQTIDKVEKILADGKQEIDEKVAESETQIDAKLKDTNDKITKANQDVATLNTNIDKANDRIDQTNQQIGDLGKLKKMYSNSIDFGGYDYSTAPNLLKTVTKNHWSNWISSVSTPNNYVKVFDDYIIIDATDPSAVNVGRNVYIPNITRLTKGKQYTLSVTMMVDDEFDLGENSYNQTAIHYTVQSNSTPERPMIIKPDKTMVNQWQRVSVKFTVPTSIKDGEYCFLHFYEGSTVTGKWYIRNDIMIQEGDQTSSQATAWKPNLLDAPYYLSKVALGENIKDKGTVFPIKTSAYAVYSGANTEPYIAGQKYTLTMKATKPATQTFNVYLNFGTIGVGSMTPVEGLTDVWQKTFTVSQAHIDAGVTDRLAIYQASNSSVGAVQIDWLKLEKGDTRTPNISEYKYFGEGLKDSNDPNDYSWDITPEYAEKSLNNTVSLTEPQTVLGLKNFSDGIQISGDHVVGENEHTIYKLDKSNSNSFIDGYATFIKHGKIVIVNGTVKFKKAYAFGVPLDDEVPEEFIARGVNGMIIGASGTSNSAKMIYVRQDFKSIMTNSEFAINEWFTFNGSYWVGEE